MDDTLSIVIPAYRAAYLATALDSLADQTDKRFQVIVGDDASPDDIRSICSLYSPALDLTYHRFRENKGATSLTAQWDRCVDLSSGAWVLLLGDDDAIDPEFVAAFRRTLKETNASFDVYRFQSRWIDADGKTTRVSDPPPLEEQWFQYLAERFRDRRFTFTCDHVFSRESYRRAGGFVDFPLAWCSDDASWIAFSARTGFRTVPGPLASWRRSGLNISSDIPQLRRTKLISMSLFLDWLGQRMRSGDLRCQSDREQLLSLGVAWFFDRYWTGPSPLSLSECFRVGKRLSTFAPKMSLRIHLRLLRHYL
ncbi:MAG: glycosyltransferase family 2 protein [Betaproteobacteria bacterium]|nr:glycosyltransferase family 2 protein [Betaproteobacteria bacterium]